MTSKTTWIILLYAIISLVAQLLILWLVDFSPLNIRESYDKLNPYGMLVLVAFIIIFIFFQKHLLRLGRETSIWKLILASTIVSFISIFLYQAIRQLVIMPDSYANDLGTVLRTTVVVVIVMSLVAASVAVEIKKVKGIWRHVPTAIALAVVLLLKKYLQNVEW